MAFHVPEKFRITSGLMASDKRCGNNGAFFVKSLKFKDTFKVIASDGEGWEHVSISLPSRCPSWAEMCFIKNLFWDESDCVVQFHPPKQEYVNKDVYCLHLWRATDADFPMPDSILVGIKEFA